MITPRSRHTRKNSAARCLACSDYSPEWVDTDRTWTPFLDSWYNIILRAIISPRYLHCLVWAGPVGLALFELGLDRGWYYLDLLQMVLVWLKLSLFESIVLSVDLAVSYQGRCLSCAMLVSVECDTPYRDWKSQWVTSENCLDRFTLISSLNEFSWYVCQWNTRVISSYHTLDKDAVSSNQTERPTSSAQGNTQHNTTTQSKE